MAQNLKVKDIVDALVARLDCTQKVIASFAGVTQTTLSTEIDRPFSEVKENKLGKRLMSLLYVVETLSRDQTLNAPIIKKVLVTPASPDENGGYWDVISAIHSGTVQNDLLTLIADVALKHLRKNYESEKRPSTNALYHLAKLG